MERLPLILSILFVLAAIANAALGQPPPMPEQDYSVDFDIKPPDGCGALNRPPQARMGILSDYSEALKCGSSHEGGLVGYDKSLAKCFDGGALWWKVRPYTLECQYKFDTNADFSTTNHSVNCTPIKGIDQAEVERFALAFGVTFKYLPPVVMGKKQIISQHIQPFKFVCE